MKSTFLWSILLALATVGSQAQTPQLEDLDGDGYYDMEEYSKMYSKGYNDWDIDGSGQIDPNEFFDGTYNRLDLDGDGKLTDQEWRVAYPEMEGLIPDDPTENYSREIFRERIGKTDYFNRYDLNEDGFVDSEEMNKAAFIRLDVNGDGRLDAGELREK